MNVEQARFNMIEQQIRPWDVLDAHVLDLLALRQRYATHFVGGLGEFQVDFGDLFRRRAALAAEGVVPEA